MNQRKTFRENNFGLGSKLKNSRELNFAVHMILGSIIWSRVSNIHVEWIRMELDETSFSRKCF